MPSAAEESQSGDSMVSSDVVNISEYEALAAAKLPKMAYDFYSAGAEDEWTLRHNKIAFSTIRIRPRILVDVSKVDLSSTILGYKVPMPIMVAPTALHKLAHRDGELATAKATASVGTIMVLSFSSSCSVEEVASASAGLKFFQLYARKVTDGMSLGITGTFNFMVFKDRKIAENLVCRAEKAGYKAIVLTGDTPRLGRRESDIRNRFILPPHVTMKNVEGLINVQKQMDKSKGSGLEAYAANTMDRSLSWKDIRWLKSITSLPIILKGVLTAEDAFLAVEAGIDGIIVSNHGARQLDYVFPTILALEEVVKAVRGRVPVYFDGGIRRGTDIFKALALGADAVLVGRPIIFGLAVDGEFGVRKTLQMLRDELELSMALAGCCSIKDISRAHVHVGGDIWASRL